jgi:hypothetical protein
MRLHCSSSDQKERLQEPYSLLELFLPLILARGSLEEGFRSVEDLEKGRHKMYVTIQDFLAEMEAVEV